MNFSVGASEWVAVVNAASSVVVALAAILASVFAARGLSAWRAELVGRHRYELSRQVLLAMREFEEVMRYVRSPVSTGDEHADIPRGPQESEEDHRLRSTYSMATLRYHKKSDYFAKLRALQFESGVLLGPEFEAPLSKALGVVDDVLRAGHMAYMFARQFNEQSKRHWAGLPPERAQVDWASKMHEKEDIYYGTGGDKDMMAKTIREAVQEAQIRFGPLIRER